ncbi:MAG: permease-like cell division protein FtsX [Lachnospiraceae bacterium]|nr:permease-like cell division protein FtsX [Lachnospiraceae bacterium]
MRISTIGYSAGQGIKNIGRNRMFSIASIATMTACIFLFGLFFSILMNFNYIVRNVEDNVGITVFFEENLDQATMDSIGEQIRSREEVTEVNYVSADEAWESFSEKYFEGNESAAEGFRNNQDNPLANSAHYEVYVDEIENQDELVSYIEGLTGVRMVNQSQKASETLSTVNTLIATISIIVILILLAVSIFLINNTVTVGISVRKEEIGIMKLIGATNTFVRLPFILEGIILGLIGAIIPLVALYFLYHQAVNYILTRFSVLEGFMNGLLPASSVFSVLLPVGLILGMGIGFLGSIFTIRRHLKV